MSPILHSCSPILLSCCPDLHFRSPTLLSCCPILLFSSLVKHFSYLIKLFNCQTLHSCCPNLLFSCQTLLFSTPLIGSTYHETFRDENTYRDNENNYKNKKTKFLYEKSLRNCPLFDMKRLFGFDRFLTSDNLFGRTIPRRLSKERFWFSRFRQWLIKTETYKLRLDNFSVFSDFFGLRAEVTLEKETPEFRKVQVRAEVKLLNFVEDDFYEFWLNSVAILSEFCFKRIFTIICWETYSLKTENLKLLR